MKAIQNRIEYNGLNPYRPDARGLFYEYQLTMYREIINACSEIHIEHINMLFWRKGRILEC
jgi:hypothetical protein